MCNTGFATELEYTEVRWTRNAGTLTNSANEGFNVAQFTRALGIAMQSLRGAVPISRGVVGPHGRSIQSPPMRVLQCGVQRNVRPRRGEVIDNRYMK